MSAGTDTGPVADPTVAADAYDANTEAEHGAAPPPAPPTASPLDYAWRWLTGGNTVVRVGIVVLFFGLAFLIKYAADHALFPIELRLAGVALFAVVLLVLGWRLTHREPEVDADDEAIALARMRNGYGLLLQGAAVGILYLTVFGAFRIYHLLPGGFAFAAMCLIVVLSAVLAVKQDSLALAAFGSAGGFLAPLLASTGGGSHVALFSFYAVLNGGIFAIAWFKSWRVLNLLGFVFTFGIGAAWGASAYRPEHFATTEPFLILFFVFYVAIAVVFALRQAPRLASYVDGTIVFGTPMVGFGLQAALVRDMPFAAAWSAVAVAAFYLLLAARIRARALEPLRLLFECFVALGVVFATLAVPLALDGRWTAATWALEGAAVVWVGMRQARLPARAFGYLVMAGAALAFVAGADRWNVEGEWAILNAAFIGRMLIALSALFVARLIDRSPAVASAAERGLVWVPALWGAFWWLVAGVAEIERWLGEAHALNSTALFVAASGLLATQAARRLDWPRLNFALLAVLPLLTIVGLAALYVNGRPFAAWGWIEWPLALALHFILLYRHEKRMAEPGIAGGFHALGVWLVTALAIAELHHLTGVQALSHSVWSAAAAALPLVAMILWLTSRRAAVLWPVLQHSRAYLVVGLSPLIVLGLAWIFYADLRYDGHAGPLPYIPFINALDLMHAFLIFAFIAWWRALAREAHAAPVAREWLFAALGAAVFFWLNAVLLRTIHHWGGVPYRFDTMMRSMLVQAALSLFWTMLALALMLIAKRRAERGIWLVGAALMGVVILKLFLVDLSNIGGIERIVSFIGVGLLMLGIGYFSPLPPKRKPAGESQ